MYIISGSQQRLQSGILTSPLELVPATPFTLTGVKAFMVWEEGAGFATSSHFSLVNRGRKKSAMDKETHGRWAAFDKTVQLRG